MAGTLVYIMGPSGAGKDCLLSYARNKMNGLYARTWDTASYVRRNLRPVFFARRFITRPPGAGGEEHCCLTREEFHNRKARGDFALSWESHGLCYGISGEIDARLAQGAVVVVNGSREYAPLALEKYPALVPVLIWAKPEVLRARLEKRGREQAADIDERLAGAVRQLPDLPNLISLDNSSTLDEAGQRFTDIFINLRRAAEGPAEGL